MAICHPALLGDCVLRLLLNIYELAVLSQATGSVEDRNLSPK